MPFMIFKHFTHHVFFLLLMIFRLLFVIVMHFVIFMFFILFVFFMLFVFFILFIFVMILCWQQGGLILMMLHVFGLTDLQQTGVCQLDLPHHGIVKLH
jgi:hypothetical protein